MDVTLVYDLNLHVMGLVFYLDEVGHICSAAHLLVDIVIYYVLRAVICVKVDVSLIFT
jgi:hypothetical protein